MSLFDVDATSKGNAEAAQSSSSGAFSDADVDEFTEACFTASSVSRRSVLFWLGIKKAAEASGFWGQTWGLPQKDAAAAKLERSRVEEVHGYRPTPAFRLEIGKELEALMQIDSWSSLFGALEASSPAPPAASMDSSMLPSGDASIEREELLQVLRGSWQDGIRKGHFRADDDFSKLHRSGTSNLFLVGNSYSKAAFMIDRSGSMASCVQVKRGDGHQYKTRFDLVCKHLLALLDERPVDFAIAVHLFDNRVDSWQGGGLVQNTPTNRRDLARFLKQNGPRGGTNLVLATKALLAVPSAQERFLLTDGECGYGDEDKIVSQLETSAGSGVPLHTIGVELSARGRSLLEATASAGGGRCCCVDGDALAADVEGLGEAA